MHFHIDHLTMKANQRWGWHWLLTSPSRSLKHGWLIEGPCQKTMSSGMPKLGKYQVLSGRVEEWLWLCWKTYLPLSKLLFPQESGKSVTKSIAIYSHECSGTGRWWSIPAKSVLGVFACWIERNKMVDISRPGVPPVSVSQTLVVLDLSRVIWWTSGMK